MERYTLEEASTIMLELGLTIRAVPDTHLELYEPQHKDKYPEGVIMYHPFFKRDMLFVHKPNGTLAGKFLITIARGTDRGIKFDNKTYDTISDAIDSVLALVKDKEQS